LNAWVVSVVLSLTVVTSVSAGILAAYGLVSGILYAFASLPKPQPEPVPQPVLLARSASAGAN
jgi:hypothetical protein